MAVSSLWMKVLAAVAAVVFVAASGWAADPKETGNPQGTTKQKDTGNPVAPAPAVKAHKHGFDGAPAVKARKRGAATADLMDLNTATKEQLMILPGIDEATARQIIRSRPFAKKDQLKSRKIISEQGYDRIKDRVVAKQPPRKQTTRKK